MSGITSVLSHYHQLTQSVSLYESQVDLFWRRTFRFLCAECFNALLSNSTIGCGVGIELKFVLTKFFAWMASASLTASYRSIFEPLRQVADVLVISKEPLIENSMRHVRERERERAWASSFVFFYLFFLPTLLLLLLLLRRSVQRYQQLKSMYYYLNMPPMSKLNYY